jgi:hypothetical protein
MEKNTGYSFALSTKNYANFLLIYFQIFAVIFGVLCYVAVDVEAIFLAAIITASCCAGSVVMYINLFSKDRVYWYFLPMALYAASFAVHVLIALIMMDGFDYNFFSAS